jgi:hypothetical protein
MTRKPKRKIKMLLAGLLILGAAQSGTAWARCQLASAIPFYLVVQVRDVIVDETLPAGTPLGREGNLNVPAGQWSFNCAVGTTPTPVRLEHSTIPAFANGLYEFIVNGQPSGVGLRLYVSDNGRPRRAFPFDESPTIPSTNPWSEPADFFTTLERVGSAPVVYGQVQVPGVNGTLAESNLYNLDGSNAGRIPYRTVRLGFFNLVRPSCTIDAASLNQTVPLGSHNVSAFSNSTPSAWVPFHLTVANCTDPTILADITFGTAADADTNDTSLFSMNQGGPQGLGIAIATAGTASVAMLPGQTQTFPTVLSGQSFPFQARLQPTTTGQVTAGTINRPVTVTVNFR